MTPMSRNQACPSKRATRGVFSGPSRLGRGRPWAGAIPRLALLGAGLFLAVGSGSEGERAETGVCPPGETCTDDMESGLYFRGPSFADGWFDADVHPMAVGGRQTITIDPVDLLTSLYDFDADCSSPAFTVASLAPPLVTVKAMSEGSAYLRILEPGTDLLYDRLLINALQVSRVTVSHSTSFLAPTPSTDLHYGGTPMTFMVRIYSGETRLIDEDVIFEAADATSVASVTQSSWDLATVRATQGATSLAVRARAADGTSGERIVPLAWEIDEILNSWYWPLPPTVVVDTSDVACFYGELGGRPVSGVPFAFRLWDPDGIEVFDTEPSSTAPTGCVLIQPTLPGLWQLSIEGPGLTKTFEFTAVDQPPPPPPAQNPQEGDGAPERSKGFQPIWRLDARSLSLAMQRLGGPGSPGCRATTYLSTPRDSDEPVPVDRAAD